MRIAVCTGGGDCPGLNAALWAVVRTATSKPGTEILGIRDSLTGLWVSPPRTRPLGPEDVTGLLDRGGTLLGTSNQGSPFRGGDQAGKILAAIKDNWRSLGLDALIVIGGDGTQLMAKQLVTAGLPVVGIPKTIDNDLHGTDLTLGHTTAVATATEAAGRLLTSAEAHDRIMVMEVMGRDAGHIAIRSGLAAGAHVILLPEIPFRYEALVKTIEGRQKAGRNATLIIVAEGAYEESGAPVFKARRQGENQCLGGIAEVVAAELGKRTGVETRVTVLGHVQRGGSPVASDRILAAQLGVRAVELVMSGNTGRLVGVAKGDIIDYGYETVDDTRRTLDPVGPLCHAAEAVGICLGR